MKNDDVRDRGAAEEGEALIEGGLFHEMGSRGWETFRGWLGMLVALLSALLAIPISCFSLLEAREMRLDNERLIADQKLNQAWDLMGGGEGADYFFRDCQRDRSELVLAKKYIDQAEILQRDNALVRMISAIGDDRGLVDGELGLNLAWSSMLHELSLDELIRHDKAALTRGVFHYCKRASAKNSLDYNEVIHTGATAHVDVGLASIERGNIDRAATSLIEALTIDPDNTPAYYYLGLLLAEEGKYAYAHSLLGHALEKQWQLDAAAEQFREAARLRPSNEIILAQLEKNTLLRFIRDERASLSGPLSEDRANVLTILFAAMILPYQNDHETLLREVVEVLGLAQPIRA